ncbi:MAG: hypothetical protein ACE149_12210 [Armatimonadota bacterium]
MAAVHSMQQATPRIILGCVLAGLACLAASTLPVRAGAGQPDSGLRLAIAVTRTGVSPSGTAISLLDPQPGVLSLVYRDAATGPRLLLKIGGSDLLGAARALPPSDIYALLGPPTAEPGQLDSLSAWRVAGQASWKQVADLPLCFSEASPYGLWSRAPLLAVSPDRSRAAVTALRAGEKVFAGPVIRVLSMYGADEWQVPLPGRDFRATDLAWSPDGEQLAYAVLPLGDEHTLDASLLPQAGVYLANARTRAYRLLQQCFPAAIAWGPRGDRLSIAVQPDVWTGAGIVRTISLTSGKRAEEFTVTGAAQALAYSPDGRWLAIQVSGPDGESLQLRASADDGWPRTIYQLPSSEGRLALLGWLQEASQRAGAEHD